MGDDHTAESSTVAHQSEFHFVDVMIPILNPAGVQEILDYGLYGYAMSRFCGTWVAFKCVKDNIESTASVDGVPRPGEDHHAGRFHHAAGRPQHPQPRRRARSGGAASGLQARRHAGVRARQQPQPHRPLRRPQPEDRHHHGRQVLSRRAPGPGRARPRRGQGERHGAAPLQGRLPVAALAARARRVRARPRQGHRGRGEALAHRGAAARGALRHRQPAGLHRQEGRGAATGSSR